MAVLQGLAALAVTSLGLAASMQEHPPKALNFSTAALGSVDAGFTFHKPLVS